MKKKSKPLGERLIDLGILTRPQLDLALKLQKRTGTMLGEILVNLGFVSDDVLSSTLAAQSHVSHVDLSRLFIEQEVIKLVPENFAKKHKLIPINLEEPTNTLTIAMDNVFDVDVISELEKRAGYFVNVVSATEQDIAAAQEVYYTGGATLDELIEESITIAAGREGLSETLVEEAPIVKLVNQFIIKGIKDGATDIHMEPEESVVRVRYRIDGVMTLGTSIPKSLRNPIVARVKILSEVNIAETRVPQDGRIKFQLGKREIDIRVSFFPTINGENVVLRLLDKGKLVKGLENLGMRPANIEMFKSCISRPFGMILVSGPTGSGKTTTLYSALSYLNSIEKNIITLEDPVEYEFPLIRQSQVNPKINFTFAEGLKSILRQDPDIILVGEMRDDETIEMSIRAALTGHLVFSTIHTNNAVNTVSRLMDMGVEPFLISSTVVLIIAQRLVRKICEFCKEPVAPGQLEIELPLALKDYDGPLYRGKGCEKCDQSGFSGRIGVYELLNISAPIREMIERKATTQEITVQAREEGFQTLFDDAVEKVREGVVTLEEAVKITMGVF
ncbi:MAG: Flp pilus assembly complex ATPase component [bacterium]|nr:Flp pilus assembly complex ATPase component [bacterium]